MAEIEKDLDQSLAEFHCEADGDRLLRETQGSIVQMLKNQEEDQKHIQEMQESIRQLLENAAVNRQTAEERNHNLDVRLGDMTQTMMQTLQADMDIKIDQALDNLRKQTIAPLEELINQKCGTKRSI
jgi:hypothetical protein